MTSPRAGVLRVRAGRLLGRSSAAAITSTRTPDPLFGEARVAEQDDRVAAVEQFDRVNREPTRANRCRRRRLSQATLKLERRRGTARAGARPVHSTFGCIDTAYAGMALQLEEQTVAAHQIGTAGPLKVPLEAATLEELGRRRPVRAMGGHCPEAPSPQWPQARASGGRGMTKPRRSPAPIDLENVPR